MSMVSESFNRLPARLVREDGKTIELSVTQYNMTVERSHSAIPVPLAHGLKWGIDMNQPSVAIELEGILADDSSQTGATSGFRSSGDVSFSFKKNISRGNLWYLPSSFTSSPSSASSIIYDETQLHLGALKMPFIEWEGDAVDGALVYFDGYRKGTEQEPNFYLNKDRTMTGITVNGSHTVVAGTAININVSSADSREWLEVISDPSHRYEVKFGSSVTGTIFASFSGTIIRIMPTVGGSLSGGEAITILKNSSIPVEHTNTSDVATLPPVIVIPVGDIINPDATYFSGTNKPKRANPSEEIAYRLYQALASTTSLGSKVTNSDTSSTNIGSTSTGGSSNRGALKLSRKNTRILYGQFIKGAVEITQQIKGKMIPGVILSWGWAMESPKISHFSGGIDPTTGDKSAGDKAQDLIGILSNSNNYNKTFAQEALTGLATLGLSVANHVFNTPAPVARGDYIEGLQLPYDSLVTAGTPQTLSFSITSAIPDSSSTIITTAEEHGFAVGDTATITAFYAGTGVTMAVNLVGAHTISAVGNEYSFTISTSTSGNSAWGDFTGSVSRDESLDNSGRKQRNFFLTHDNAGVSKKTSIANTTPSSSVFIPNDNSHRAAGIKGAVEEFNVEYNAAEKVYEFALLFRAARWII